MENYTNIELFEELTNEIDNIRDIANPWYDDNDRLREIRELCTQLIEKINLYM